jgi:hypothetical protein
MHQRSLGAHLAFIRQLTESHREPRGSCPSFGSTSVVNFRNRLVTNGNRDLKPRAGRGL